ncbi:hypothetical protein ES702_01450 [subsurface metagenome]
MTYDEPMCVIEICKGYCCEHISNEVRKNLFKLGLRFEKVEKDVYRCLDHDKETGLCNNYENRTWYCKWYFCPSAKRGFMRQAQESIDKEKENLKIEFEKGDK